MSLKFETKRLEILKAAQKRFIRHGLFKTTIEEIARDMRISKSSLYHYFKSKEEIYYRCVELEMADFFGEIASILNDENMTPEDKLDKYFLLKNTLPKQFRLLYLLHLIVLSEQSTPLEDDLLLKFMQEEIAMFANAMHIIFPDMQESTITRLKMTFPIVSSAIPVVSGFHDTINQKVDYFAAEVPAAALLIEQWKKFLAQV